MSIDADSLKAYNENKSKLADALKKNGSLSLVNRPSHGHVGLWNQGATCYLNSVIQTMFWDVEFRNSLFAGAGGDNAVLNQELKRLVTQLQLSEQPAVSTKPLTVAFGWKDGQSHEQHDAHELYSLLLDSMDASSKALFEAKMKDSLVCPSCSNVYSSSTANPSLSLDIPDSGGEDAGGHKLADLIQSYLEPEELDADNKWVCSKCSEKVQAMKSVSVQSFPNKLVVQLKRFRFDPASRRRRKLNCSVLFPLSLTAQELVNKNNPAASLDDTDASAVYDLTSVVVHTGTAQGGHYRAYCRDTSANQWVDFNDGTVTVLDEAERDALFWFSAAAGAEDAATRRDLVYENVYMLQYSRRVDAVPSAAALPADLVAEVEAENAAFRELQKAYEVMKSIVCARVHAINSSGVELGAAVSVDLSVTCTLHEATQTAAKALVERGAGAVPDHTANPAMYRLRRYNSSSKLMTETFTDKAECSLAELGFEGGNFDAASAPTFALEIKCDERVAFVDFNPNEMRVRCFAWSDLVAAGYGSSEAESDAYNYAFPVSVTPVVHVVPGDDQATVGDLRGLVAAQHGVAVGVINIVRCTNKLVQNVDDDASPLRSYNISPDDAVVVEVISPPDAETTRANFTSVAMEKLSQLRRNITLQFNNPFGEAAADATPEYSLSIKVPLDAPLLDVKQQICSVLNSNGATVAVDGFHLRRNNTGAPQLKDESKTLEELEFVNFSVIHVQAGCGCKVGEFMLRFELDHAAVDNALPNSDTSPTTVVAIAEGGAAANTLVSLGEVVVREKMTVAQVKALVVARIEEVLKVEPVPGLVMPPSIEHIRLRDGKNKTPGVPLRDERMISRCLLNMDDGRRVVVQVLAEPEVIAADDIVISVRVASYYNKTLSKPADVIINKSTTIAKLYETLTSRYPYLAEEVSMADGADDASAAAVPACMKLVAIAKGYATGPPLTLKSALKLKWNDEMFVKDMEGDPSNTVDKAPMLLRDGSVLVIRSQADFERARAVAVQAKKLANLDNSAPLAAPAGTSSATRARLASRGGTRGSRGATSTTAPASREPSLKISASSPGIVGADSESVSVPSSAGGGAVRMVQALKESSV